MSLLEAVMEYRKNNSDVYLCFLDIPKAFDNVDHDILLNKLQIAGLSAYYINMFSYIFKNQRVFVQHNNVNSNAWYLGSGVQGGI